MIETIGDVAEELNRLYRSFLEEHEIFKKGEKSKFFLQQEEALFQKFGTILGYISLSEFKRDLQFCRQRIKEQRKSFSFKNFIPCVSREEDSANHSSSDDDNFNFNEGSNTLTSKQILNFGLDPDSY